MRSNDPAGGLCNDLVGGAHPTELPTKKRGVERYHDGRNHHLEG